MNKIKYDIIIGKERFDLYISSIYNNEKIFRYSKSALKKLKIDYLYLIKKEFNIISNKCPFCGEDSKYNILYEIDNFSKKVIIKGISEIIVDNKINYHCKGGKNKCKGSKLNPNSIEYISIAFNITLEEAKKYLHDRNKSPFYKNNHKSDDDYKKYQTRNLDWYINKFGINEGTLHYNNNKNKISVGNSKDSLIKKYGIDGFNIINQKKAICNINHFIEKFGDKLGPEKFEKYKKSLGNTRDQYIEKFGLDEWNNLRINIEKKKSLEYFIQLFGFDLGLENYNKLRKSSARMR